MFYNEEIVLENSESKFWLIVIVNKYLTILLPKLLFVKDY